MFLHYAEEGKRHAEDRGQQIRHGQIDQKVIQIGFGAPAKTQHADHQSVAQHRQDDRGGVHEFDEKLGGRGLHAVTETGVGAVFVIIIITVASGGRRIFRRSGGNFCR